MGRVAAPEFPNAAPPAACQLPSTPGVPTSARPPSLIRGGGGGARNGALAGDKPPGPMRGTPSPTPNHFIANRCAHLRSRASLEERGGGSRPPV